MTFVLDGVLIDPDAALRDLDRVEYEDSFYSFVKAAWKYVDSAPFTPGWGLQAICEHLQAVCDGEIKRLIINIPPRSGKSTLTSVMFPAWVWAQPYDSATSGPGARILCASYAKQLVIRDSVQCRKLIESQWYQALWGDRFELSSDQNTKNRFSNNKNGERLTTSVEATLTGEGGNIVVIDDANAANEVSSDTKIQAVIDWWDGTMSTRHNDPKLGAFIVIQQRLAENDLTGHILENSDEPWEHLMLPMRFEGDRVASTRIGWRDPRTREGQLMWPERFGEDEVKRLEKALGPWMCNPAEAPILMADTTMKPIGDVRPGDVVMGFDKRDKKKGTAYSRQKLTPSKVLEVHTRTSSVVKITLDSGEVIRCTPEHKWFTKDRGDHREMYAPATLRSSLARICPPTLPKLTPEEQRDAGWLSGLFDGEGTVSLAQREENNYPPSAQILFYQGAGKNLPLCEKLERLLTHFGFEFTIQEDERKPNKNATCYGYRSYKIKNEGIISAQRFLHIVQPTKRKDRIIDGCYKSNFIQRREKVVSIEPDGEEAVYALTTETGNYVVWGLASSNSAGQLQQRPEPKGGGIIKREWWKLWDRPKFPLFEFIIASLDTAYTTKEENDPSAMTVWGIFSESDDDVAQAARIFDSAGRPMYQDRMRGIGAPKLMLMYAWTGRFELHDLVTKTHKTCIDCKVDTLLIENKAAGISVAQELQRMHARYGYGVELDDPKSQDKMARLYSVQHLFAEGLIYAPDKTWAEAVITQAGQFPRGKHDDFVDTLSSAIRRVRAMGLLVRSEEHREDMDAQITYPGGEDMPLYPS